MKNKCKWKLATAINRITILPQLTPTCKHPVHSMFSLQRNSLLIDTKITKHSSECIVKNVNCMDYNDAIFTKWKSFTIARQIKEEEKIKKQRLLESQKLELFKNNMDDMLDKMRIEEINKRILRQTKEGLNKFAKSTTNYSTSDSSLIKLKKQNSFANEKALYNQDIRIKSIDEYTGMLKQEITNNKTIFANSLNIKKLTLENALHHASQISYYKNELLKAIKEVKQDYAINIMKRCNELIHEHYAVLILLSV